MQRNTPTCFISYSHDGIDRDTLDYLLFLLKDQFKYDVSLLFDQDVEYGADFREFMALLDDVDAVVILLTPQYHSKILTRTGGVYEEYRRIMLRYNEQVHVAKHGPGPGGTGFYLVPVILSGTADSSVPEELRSLKYLNLVGLRALRDKTGGFVVPDRMAQPYIAEVRKLARKIGASLAGRGEDFALLYDRYFRRLFIELKSDWENPEHEGTNYVESLFVRTSAYKKVRDQTVLFVTGRKGSGKSTLTDILAIQGSQRYRGVVTILADTMNLEFVYSLFEVPRLRSETYTAFPRTRCFEFAWRALMYICCMDVIAANVRGLPDAEMDESERRVVSALDLIRRGDYNFDDHERIMGYFTYAYNAVEGFIEHCIAHAREDETYFWSDLAQRFTVSEYLRFALTSVRLTPFGGSVS